MGLVGQIGWLPCFVTLPPSWAAWLRVLVRRQKRRATQRNRSVQAWAAPFRRVSSAVPLGPAVTQARAHAAAVGGRHVHNAVFLSNEAAKRAGSGARFAGLHQ